MRPFSEFRLDVDPRTASIAEQSRMTSLATWGYLLHRPGMEFVRQRSNFILGWRAAAQAGDSLQSGVSAGAVGDATRPPIGSWMLLPHLTSPATQTVLPSNDALYGAAHVELDHLGPVVLTVPPNIDDRYYSVTVVDAHMNNVAHIGPRWTGNGAGHFLVVPPGWTGQAPDGMPVIASPTVSIALYNRMLVRFEADDITRVREWQAGLRITTLSAWPDVDAIAPDVEVDDLVHPTINGLTDAQEYLRIAIAHERRNPLPSGGSWLAWLVATSGVSTDEPLRTAVERGVDDATALIDATLATWPRVRGWMMPDTTLGLPNPDVLRSAAFQQFQIGSNDAAESVYYFTDTDAHGDLLDASGGRAYALTFPETELPPHCDGGYWSITMYDEHSHLVANAIDRYATRPTRPGTVLDVDGSLTFVFASRRPTDTAEANWLPAPDGRFRLGLRLYYPMVDKVNSGWAPPAVRNVD